MLVFLPLIFLVVSGAECTVTESLARCNKAKDRMKEGPLGYIIVVENMKDIFRQKKGCFISQNGWWVYEFCVGQYIREIHIEKGVINDENFLGFGQGVQDATSSLLSYRDGQRTIQDSIAKHYPPSKKMPDPDDDLPEYRYECDESAVREFDTVKYGVVIQSSYDSGTYCESTSSPRRATVSFVCSQLAISDIPNKLPAWMEVTEVSSCVYHIIVKGDWVCSLLGEEIPPRIPDSRKVEEEDAKTNKQKIIDIITRRFNAKEDKVLSTKFDHSDKAIDYIIRNTSGGDEPPFIPSAEVFGWNRVVEPNPWASGSSDGQHLTAILEGFTGVDDDSQLFAV
eukprot:Tbor_TRINITY_DN2358_c0_g1::TRINITY_DN2358_c0_g1_i2::g.95::m.95